MTLSVIIPTFNEGAYIEACLNSIRSDFSGEVIIVDGGSCDGTTAKAMNYSTRIFSTETGVSRQCNEGVKEAMSSVCLFVSADSVLEKGWYRSLQSAMDSAYVVGGGFRLGIDDPRWVYRLLSFGGNFRASYSKFALGDQGLFVRKDSFVKAGGFREESSIPYAYLCYQLRTMGEFVFLPETICSSAREWNNGGVFTTTLKHMWTYLKFRYRELPHFA